MKWSYNDMTFYVPLSYDQNDVCRHGDELYINVKFYKINKVVLETTYAHSIGYIYQNKGIRGEGKIFHRYQ